MNDQDKTKEQLIAELAELRRRTADLEKLDGERKRAEEDLRTSRLHLAEAADLARIAYWEHDEAAGELILNDAFYTLYGTTAGQEGGYRMRREEFFARFVHPDDRDELRRQVAANRAHARPGDIWQYEHRAVRRDGEVIHILARIMVVLDKEGRPLRVVGVNQDITARKNMEEALREYEKAIEGSPDMMAVVDREYRYRIANSVFIKNRGLDRNQVVGRSVSYVLGADVFEQMVKEKLDRCFEGQPVQYEMKYAYPGVGERDLLISYLPIQGSQGIERVAAIIRDITEDKKTYRALRKSEEKYQALFETVRDGFASVRMDKRMVQVNPAFLDMVGYTAEELLNMTYEDLTPEKWRTFEESIIQGQVLTRGYSDVYVKEYVRKDGTVFPIEIRTHLLRDEEDRPSGMWAFVRDVTERRRAEDEVGMLKHSIDVHYDGAYWMNTDNEFVYVNEAACKAVGYEREELIGKTVYEINPRATAERMKAVWEGLRKGTPSFVESLHRRKDGSVFPVEVVSTYVQFDGREYVCGFVRDITEKKRLEEQLRQAQKMEAVGTLAGGVAHDFNNILTVIMGFANLIQATIGKDDLLRPYVDQIVTSSERAADLTQSLLAFSRKQRITLEPHRVNGVVTSTAKLLMRLLPEDIKLTINLADEDTFSLLDVTQIGQVLMNLATNARDAMPHGGSLIITTARATLDNDFKRIHGFGRPGEYVKLSVLDTGTGMDEPTMEHIFEPFFTTKEVGRGTGLGLASAYGIVKQHSGYIDVSSALFKGTTFDLFLPLIEPPQRQKAPAAGEAKRGVETILIVEDDRDVRNMLTRILESHGYTAVGAADGADGIRVHREQKKRVDLVILDVVMPGKNGREVLEEISRIDPTVKVIFVSGYTGDIVIDKGIQSENVDFLQKPLSVTALLSKVREVLDR